MAFAYDNNEEPLRIAQEYVGYIIQTIQNHPESATLERIEGDLIKLSKILEKI